MEKQARKHKKRSVLERFNEKYVINEETDCWEWTDYLNPDGYGRLQINKTSIGAHRVAYELFIGPIPDGLFVLHSCDNPPCVNPLHLFLGTTQDNTQDKINKNRQQKGEADRYSKLTEQEVLEIRARYTTGGITHKQLADNYNVTPGTIYFVVNKITWTHI